MSLREHQLREALGRLNASPDVVVVHSSLRSFGWLDGGPDALIAALAARFETVMMPAFSFESNAPPPPGDRPARNGCNYAFYEGWTRPLVPFVVERAPVDKKMGAVSRRFAELAGTRRSAHPWHSWAARGARSGELVRDHPLEVPNLPLSRAADAGGWVLLAGVGLSSCTALHLAEERAGRRPFIRWAATASGAVRRMRVSGCAKGFDQLTPICQRLFETVDAGPCRMSFAPLEPLIEAAARAFAQDPTLGRCSETCLRCRDASQGGPLE